MKKDPSSQRLFQKDAQNFILLSKEGKAVQFRLDSEKNIHVMQRLDDVDFKATGDGLRSDGWRCVGPGLEYEDLLE